MALAADPCRYAVVGLGRRRARRRLRRRRGAPGARAWGSDAHVAGRHRSAHLLGRTRSFRLGGLHRTRGGHGADRGLFADASRVLLDRAPLKRAGYSTRWARRRMSSTGDLHRGVFVLVLVGRRRVLSSAGADAGEAFADWPAVKAAADHFHMAVWPPSTNNSVPVTNDASSDARNKMHAATSSGVPGRFRIVLLAASSRYCSSVRPSSRVRFS